MIIYECKNTGVEVVSDSYGQEAPFGMAELAEVGFQCTGSFITKGGEDYGIENNDEDGGGGEEEEKVIDIKDSFQLVEILTTKKSFPKEIKKYIKSIISEFTTPESKAAIGKLVEKVVSMYDEITLLVPQDEFDAAVTDMTVALVFEYWDQSGTPKYVYIKNGLKEVKA